MSNKYLSADDFLTGIQGGETDMEIDGLGVICVRSLTTTEVQFINTTATGDNMRLSMLAIRYGMVAPTLTDDHLSALEAAKPGVIALIAKRIMDLSGMGADFEKKVGSGS